MDLKERYNKLKDKIVDNFNYWLNSYIAIDISEAGEVDYLITDIDEYYFYLQLEQELKFCIDDLINQDESGLLIKFIELKKILNIKIQESKHFNQKDLDDIYNEFDSDETQVLNNSNTFPEIIIHRNIENPQLIIDTLFKKLISNEFINCELKDFQSLFLASKESMKITWLSSRVNLMGLIHLMRRYKIISETNITNTKIAYKYFKAKEDQFKVAVLDTTNSKVKKRDDENDSMYSEIKDIIFELKNL